MPFQRTLIFLFFDIAEVFYKCFAIYSATVLSQNATSYISPLLSSVMSPVVSSI